MSMDQVANLIQTFGFSSVFCGAMGYVFFLAGRKLVDAHILHMREESESLKRMVADQGSIAVSLAKITSAIERMEARQQQWEGRLLAIERSVANGSN